MAKTPNEACASGLLARSSRSTARPNAASHGLLPLLDRRLGRRRPLQQHLCERRSDLRAQQGRRAHYVLWCHAVLGLLASAVVQRRHTPARQPDVAPRTDEQAPCGACEARLDGIIDVDYESWSPSWNLTSESYRNASRALARTQLPAGASDAAIETKAVADYNAAGLAFMETTLRHVQAYAPRARVGFYGRPTAPYYHYNATLLHKVNEALLPMYNASSVLMPSIYLPYRSGVDTSFANIATFVRDRLAQASDVNAMLVARGEAPKPVVPYAWYRYHDGGPSSLIHSTPTTRSSSLRSRVRRLRRNQHHHLGRRGRQQPHRHQRGERLVHAQRGLAATASRSLCSNPRRRHGRSWRHAPAAHDATIHRPTEPPPPFTACSLSERTAQLENQPLASPWAAHGIGLHDDLQDHHRAAARNRLRLLGSNGWVVLFLQPVIQCPLQRRRSRPSCVPRMHATLVIVRLGWAGAMRDYADPGTNATGFRRVAVQIAAVVDALPLPPPESGPLYVHAGNELNACNEWRCTEPANQTLSLDTRAREVAGFMSDTFAGLAALAAVRNGSVLLAHASIADWQTDGCVCDQCQDWHRPKGDRVPRSAARGKARPLCQRPLDLLHSYPYSNANWSSTLVQGVAWPRVLPGRRRAQPERTLPVAITETGWARIRNALVKSDDDQASWMHRAADEIWKRDPSVVAVAPFLLGGRFWEARGWQFVDCPPSNSTDAPCDGELAPRAVFDAWRRAGRML